MLRSLCCGAVQFADVRNLICASERLKCVSNELGKELSWVRVGAEAPTYLEPHLALVCVCADLGYFLLLPSMKQAHLQALGCFSLLSEAQPGFRKGEPCPQATFPFLMVLALSLDVLTVGWAPTHLCCRCLYCE